MLLTRQHVLAACTNGEVDIEARHWKSELVKRFPELKLSLTANDPPPERELIYKVQFFLFEQFKSSSTKEIYAIAVTDTIFLLPDHRLKPGVLTSISNLVKRLKANNKSIKFYGVNVLFLFSPEVMLQHQSNTAGVYDFIEPIYTDVAEWLVGLKLQLDFDVTADLVCNEGDLEHILRNEVYRIKYGDMQMQYGSI